MVCSLGYNPGKNAYHIIIGYLKELERLDVLPLQLKCGCASCDSKESVVVAFLRKQWSFL